MLALELILMTIIGFVAGFYVSYFIGSRAFYSFKDEIEKKLLEHGIKLTYGKDTK